MTEIAIGLVVLGLAVAFVAAARWRDRRKAQREDAILARLGVKR